MNLVPEQNLERMGHRPVHSQDFVEKVHNLIEKPEG